MTIATVVFLSGQAWARDAEGNLRELRVGDTLLEGETLVTADNARVELDFGDNLDPTVIGGGQEIAMTPDLDADQPVAVEDASALDEDLEALLAALDDDEVDLLDVFDATAAGAGAGGGGGDGHNFVRLARIAEDTDPLAFDFSVGQFNGPPDIEGQGFLAEAQEEEPPVDEAPGEEPPVEEPPVEEPELAPGTITVVLGDANSSNAAAVPVSGTTTNVPPGSTVTIVVTDQAGNSATTTAITSEDGGYETVIDLSGLVDGPLTAEASTIDQTGSTVNANDDAIKDSIAEASITIDMIAGDDVINGEEAQGDITLTGTVGGDAREGDTVTLTVGGQDFTGSVSGDLTYAIDVPGSLLAQHDNVQANVAGQDDAGNPYSADAVRPYDVNLSAEASITIDVIAGDDVINGEEAQGDITLTGTVGGDAREGDTVTLTVGGQDFTGSVSGDLTYAIDVPGSLLAQHDNVQANVAGQDDAGNPYSADTVRPYDVDTQAPTVTVSFAEDTLAIGETSEVTIDFSEVAHDPASGEPLSAAQLAALLVVNGGTLSDLTQDGDNATVWTATFTPDDGFTGDGAVSVPDQSYADAAGNLGGPGSDTIGVYAQLPEIIGLVESGDVTVNEKFLESGTHAGQGEPNGAGTFTIIAAGGLASLTIYGKEGAEEFTFAELEGLAAEGVTISVETEKGLLTLTDFEDLGDGRYEVTYEYLLGEAFEHPEGDGRNEADKDPIDIKVTDSNGNTAANQINVTIIDDVPSIDADNISAVNVQGVYSGSYNFVVGADQQTFLESFSGHGLTWLNQPVDFSFELDEAVSTADSLIYKAYGTDDELFFVLTIKSDGTYDFELVNPLPVTETQVSGLLQGVSGGSGLESYTFDSAAFGGMFSLVLSGSDANGDAGIWISSSELGVGDGVVHGDDTLKFDVVRTEQGDAVNASISALTLTLATTAGLKSNDKVTFTVYYENGSEEINLEVGPKLGSGSNTYHEVTIELDPAREVEYITLQPYDGSVQFKITGVSLGYHIQEFPDDYHLQFELTGVDADLDEATADFEVFVNTASDSGYVIVGTEGNDSVYGSTGNDILIGGAGDDILTGGFGDDVFQWNLGDQGEEEAAATDVVKDFGEGHNVLDLADLLQGEESGDINDFIFAEQEGDNTTLYIKHDGGLGAGGANADQKIVLENHDMGGMTSEDFLQQLLSNDQLNIDQ